MLVKQYVKLLFHSFVNFHRNFKGEDHRMCWIRKTTGPMDLQDNFKFKVVEMERHYCTCGYQDEDGEARKTEQEYTALFEKLYDRKKETDKSI